MVDTTNNNGWGGASTLLSGFGGIVGAVGAYQSARAQKARLQYEANIADANASLAEDNSRLALVIGQKQQYAHELKTNQVFGSQRASMAANGVDLGQGSANEVLASTKFMSGVDSMTIADNAAQQSKVLGVEADNYRMSAKMARDASDSINPNMAAGSSLLGGAASFARLLALG